MSLARSFACVLAAAFGMMPSCLQRIGSGQNRSPKDDVDAPTLMLVNDSVAIVM
jgi:hypothetical protein